MHIFTRNLQNNLKQCFLRKFDGLKRAKTDFSCPALLSQKSMVTFFTQRMNATLIMSWVSMNFNFLANYTTEFRMSVVILKTHSHYHIEGVRRLSKPDHFCSDNIFKFRLIDFHFEQLILSTIIMYWVIQPNWELHSFFTNGIMTLIAKYSFYRLTFVAG